MNVLLAEAEVPYDVVFEKDNNRMLFGDAKKMLDEVLVALMKD